MAESATRLPRLSHSGQNAKMNRPFDIWLVLGLGLIVAVLAISGSLAYWNTYRLDVDATWVAHTHEVMDLTDDVLRTLVDAETGERGFIITGKEAYLEPYNAARQQLGGLMTTLQEKTIDNGPQQERIKRLQGLTTVRLDQLKEAIELRRESAEKVPGLIATGKGKVQMDAIRELIAEMKGAEQKLLQERQGQTHRTFLLALTSAIVCSVLGLTMVGAYYWLLRRSLSARHHAALVIHQQREWFRTTLASVGDAVIATDTRGQIAFLNSTAASLTGWPPAEAAGKPLGTVFHIINEATRKPAENPATRALREGQIVGLANHTVLIHKDGRERAIDDSAAPIRDANGNVAGVVLVFRDITLRRQAERSARLLASIVESSDDAIIGKDLHGIITSWNRGAERIFGYTAAEAIGRPVSMLAPPLRLDEMPNILQRIKHGERIEHFDTERQAKDGRLVPISLTVSPIRNGEGQIIGASKVARDISERKRAEEALREEKARLQATLTGIGDGVIVTDAEGRITLMNPVAQALTGWKDEATGRPLADAFRIINEESRQTVESPVSRVIREGTVVGLANHTILLAKDGTERPIDDSGAPVRNSQGDIIAVVLVFRDITDRRRAEQALQDATRRKDEFLATLSHELRNPLAPLRTAVELLRRAGADADLREKARNVIERQVGQMVRLVDELLDMSRITSGKIQLRREQVELSALVRSVVDECRPLIEGQRHELTVTLPAHPVYLEADPTRLAQVFSNLLNNAAKYTEKGGHIWLSAERQNCEVVISVRDTGIGIAPEHLAHVFEMFSQLTPALERSQGGLGIGLALVRGLVELHDGTVEAHSDGPGKGSEFMVRLPVVDHPRPSLSEPMEQAKSLPTSSRRILVVDDNRDAADSLVLMLQMMGHEGHTAYDGLEAANAAETWRPDVVLLDIGMPKMNGYEVARHLRQQPWGNELALVALTGWGQEEDKRRAHEAGFDHHLTKPVDAAALGKLIDLINPNMQGA